MFEFDAGKFVLIAIVALIVIGPKELPRVMRQVGQAVAKLRRLSSEFQAQFMEAMREADLEEVRTEAAKIAAAAKMDHDPLAGIRAELTKTIEAPVAREPAVETTVPLTPTEMLFGPLGGATPQETAQSEAPQKEAVQKEAAQEAFKEALLAEREMAPVPVAVDVPAQPLPEAAIVPDTVPPGADVTPLRKRG